MVELNTLAAAFFGVALVLYVRRLWLAGEYIAAMLLAVFALWMVSVGPARWLFPSEFSRWVQWWAWLARLCGGAAVLMRIADHDVNGVPSPDDQTRLLRAEVEATRNGD